MVTKSRDLRTGRSVWQSRRAPPLAHRRLNKNAEGDVLIIGAGITGAMVADCLAEAGLRIIIADKRGTANGATTASTALVQHEIDTPLTQLKRKIGTKDAVRAWRRSRLAVDGIAARLGELGIADVQRRDTLYLAGDLLDADQLEQEHHARRAAGLASTLLSRKELRSRFGIARSAALMSYDGLTIDPRRTTLALLKAAQAYRTTIYCPEEITDIEASRSGVTATTTTGHRIRCRSLVYATGYELPKHIPHPGHKIISTWPLRPRRRSAGSGPSNA